MDIKEFAQEFIDNVKTAVDMGNKEYDLELASDILEYMTDSGEINAPELCYFQKTRSRITAYDYNDEAESLDLFYLIKADTLIGKINNNKVQQGFNFLQSFYREAMEGTLYRSQNVTVSDEITEITTLIQSSKGQISQLRLYILTDGLTDPTAVPTTVENEEQHIIIEFNVWDMQRIYQQHNLRAGKEKIEIDFPTNYNIEIQCLKMSEENPLMMLIWLLCQEKRLLKYTNSTNNHYSKKMYVRFYSLKEKSTKVFDVPSEKNRICFSLITMGFLLQPVKLRLRRKEEVCSLLASIIGKL